MACALPESSGKTYPLSGQQRKKARLRATVPEGCCGLRSLVVPVFGSRFLVDWLVSDWDGTGESVGERGVKDEFLGARSS